MKVELDKVREIVKKLGFYVPSCDCHEHSCCTCGWNGKKFLSELDKLEIEEGILEVAEEIKERRIKEVSIQPPELKSGEAIVDIYNQAVKQQAQPKPKYLNHRTKDGELGFHEGIIFVSSAVLKTEYLTIEQCKEYLSSFKNISTEIIKHIKTEPWNE